ncbi:hypothetical protein [Winogradskyella sp. PE311]|uniref:hypothetical protein n=1 Tax=Winogradskyella sp. PE311 TaxID=3366943 RepID=UPI00397F6196
MKLKNSVIYDLSIVLVGNFNPSIITPSWLAYKKLIRESDSENADITIIHPEISHFSLSFCEFQVSMDKCIITAENEADFELIRDLSISIFSFLNETPISGIGINHNMHFGLENEDDYNRFGDWLAPLNIWNNHLRNPKLLELKVIEPFEDNNPVKNMITVTTSDKISIYGVRYQLNYHIELSRVKNKLPAEVISKHWHISFEKAKQILNSTIEKFYA